MDASVQLSVAAVKLVRCIETLLGAVKLPVTGAVVVTDTVLELVDAKVPFTATI